MRRVAGALDDAAVLDDERRAAAADVAPHPPIAAACRVVEDGCAHAARDGRDQRIVGVERDRAVGSRDAADDRLDLGQLGQRVDALQVQVVGADVGQHARVVRLVAEAAQQDAAARRLEDANVDRRLLEDARAPAGPV